MPNLNMPNRGKFENMPQNRRNDMRKSDVLIPDANQIVIDNWSYFREILKVKLGAKVDEVINKVPTQEDFRVGTFEEDLKGIDIIRSIKIIEENFNIGYRVLTDRKGRSIGIRVERVPIPPKTKGTPTEYDKLLKKPLDIYFFGWSKKIGKREEDRVLVDWVIYDPCKFVDLGFLELAKERKTEWPGETPVETYWGWVPVEEAFECILCSKRNLAEMPVSLSLF